MSNHILTLKDGISIHFGCKSSLKDVAVVTFSCSVVQRTCEKSEIDLSSTFCVLDACRLSFYISTKIIWEVRNSLLEKVRHFEKVLGG